MSNTVYDYSVKKIGGEATKLADYKGEVLLVVNVASKCGLTPQYEGLESLYERFHGQGFEVLGFPANEFLAQEPGTNEEIQSFCQTKFGVKFPMFEKIVVKGPGQHPLYKFMTEYKPIATLKPHGSLMGKLDAGGLLTGKDHDIKWNFEKFLINKKGEIVERFSPELDPQDPLIVEAIEKELAL